MKIVCIWSIGGIWLLVLASKWKWFSVRKNIVVIVFMVRNGQTNIRPLALTFWNWTTLNTFRLIKYRNCDQRRFSPSRRTAFGFHEHFLQQFWNMNWVWVETLVDHFVWNGAFHCRSGTMYRIINLNSNYRYFIRKIFLSISDWQQSNERTQAICMDLQLHYFSLNFPRLSEHHTADEPWVNVRDIKNKSRRLRCSVFFFFSLSKRKLEYCLSIR